MEDGHVVMPEEEFEQFLELAVERGAKRALADVGLVDDCLLYTSDAADE